MRSFKLSLILLLIANVVRASEFTIGPDGINSKGLGLTGSGIAIGQIELGRPGSPGKDMDKYVHPQVQPTDVYSGTSVDSANSALVTDPDWGVHATQVAGVMIAKPTPLGSVEGVAPDAGLYAGGMNGVIGQGTDIRFALTANRIATLPAIVRAINVSAGRELNNFLENTDGNQHWTQFVDWSARVHDVLYVVGGSEGVMVDVPQDNFKASPWARLSDWTV